MWIFALIKNYIGELQICLGSFLATLWIYGPQGKSTELVIRAYEIYWFINCINPITFTQYCNEMTHWFYLISKVICKLNCSLNISLVTPKLYPWNARQWISILRNKSSSISTPSVSHPSVMKFSKKHCCSALFSRALKHQQENHWKHENVNFLGSCGDPKV